MKEITRKNIIEYIRSVDERLTKKEATMVVNAVFDNMIEIFKNAINNNEDIRLSIKGFGSFQTALKPAQRRFNPHSRQYEVFPSKRIVKFKRSKSLSCLNK